MYYERYSKYSYVLFWTELNFSLSLSLSRVCVQHQPTTWTSFFFDLHILVAVFPAGVWLCARELNDERVFIILYAVSAAYFSGVMVRTPHAFTVFFASSGKALEPKTRRCLWDIFIALDQSFSMSILYYTVCGKFAPNEFVHRNGKPL